MLIFPLHLTTKKKSEKISLSPRYVHRYLSQCRFTFTALNIIHRSLLFTQIVELCSRCLNLTVLQSEEPNNNICVWQLSPNFTLLLHLVWLKTASAASKNRSEIEASPLESFGPKSWKISVSQPFEVCLQIWKVNFGGCEGQSLEEQSEAVEAKTEKREVREECTVTLWGSLERPYVV